MLVPLTSACSAILDCPGRAFCRLIKITTRTLRAVDWFYAKTSQWHEACLWHAMPRKFAFYPQNVSTEHGGFNNTTPTDTTCTADRRKLPLCLIPAYSYVRIYPGFTQLLVIRPTTGGMSFSYRDCHAPAGHFVGR